MVDTLNLEVIFTAYALLSNKYLHKKIAFFPNHSCLTPFYNICNAKWVIEQESEINDNENTTPSYFLTTFKEPGYIFKENNEIETRKLPSTVLWENNY